ESFPDASSTVRNERRTLPVPVLEPPWVQHQLFRSPGWTSNPFLRFPLLKCHRPGCPLSRLLGLGLSAQTQPCRPGELPALPDPSWSVPSSLASACWQRASAAGTWNSPQSCPVWLLPAAPPRQGSLARPRGKRLERTG